MSSLSHNATSFEEEMKAGHNEVVCALSRALEAEKSPAARGKLIAALRAYTMKRYVHGIPRKPLPKGIVLVHNHIVPQRELGLNGFRAWTQLLDDGLEVCRCDWAGMDLRGLTHYRVRRSRMTR